MCYESCFMLYEVGVNLKDLTCPCGCGFWDCFEKAFVTGDQVRHGKGSSRAAHEARVRAELSPEEYKARLREQFIVHFLKCEKQKQTAANSVKGASIVRRASAELSEIRKGDFTSQGRTVSQNAKTTTARPTDDARLPALDRDVVVPSLPSLSSSRDRDGGAQTTRKPRDEARDLLRQRLATQQRSVTSEQLEVLVSQYMARSEPEEGPVIDTGASKTKRKTTLITQFLPREGIELSALNQWLNNNISSSATARPYTHKKDGKTRDGFLVEAERALDVDMIAQIKKESKLAASSGRERASASPPDTSLFPSRHDRHSRPAPTGTSHDLVPSLAQLHLASARSAQRDSRRESDDDDSESSDSGTNDPRDTQRPREHRYSSSKTRDAKASTQGRNSLPSVSQTSTNTTTQRTSSYALSSSRHTTTDPRQPAQRHTPGPKPRTTRTTRNDADSDVDDDDRMNIRPAPTDRDREPEPTRRDGRPEPGRRDSNRERPKERMYHR